MTLTVSSLPVPRGILFDMDGTLVDSDDAVVRNWQAFAARHDLDADEIVTTCHGIPAVTTIRRFLPEASEEVIEHEYGLQVELECTDLEGVHALPGASELLAYLDAAGIAWAVATSAGERLARLRLGEANLPHRVLVSREMYEHGKPAPDAFLMAAERIGVPAEECWVVEDSPAGLAAAEASGGAVVNVGPGGTNLPALLAHLRALAARSLQ